VDYITAVSPAQEVAYGELIGWACLGWFVFFVLMAVIVSVLMNRAWPLGGDGEE